MSKQKRKQSPPQQSATHVPTREKLARALEKAIAPTEMVVRARAGYYDEFSGNLDFPIVQLARDATRCGLIGIAAAAQNGKFDAQRWESDAWRASPEGQAAFQQFGHLLSKTND